MKNNILTFGYTNSIQKTTKNYIEYIENNLFSNVVKTPENVRRYKGQTIKPFLNEFTSVICYVASLNKAVVMEDYSHVTQSIKEDLKLAQSKGELCVYLSIVTNALLRDLFPHINCSLVQGFYTYASKNHTTHSYNAECTGFHAFSVVGEKVIDCCFFSTDPEYKTPAPAIIGEVPDDIHFYGWEESVSLEQKYIEEYALANHKGIIDWLCAHSELQKDFLIASII